MSLPGSIVAVELRQFFWDHEARLYSWGSQGSTTFYCEKRSVFFDVQICF